MPKIKFYLKGHARSDITRIRRYTIDTWGEEQWIKYKTVLFNKLQLLADNPETGIKIEEISDNAFRFPLKDHVVYYLKGDVGVVFVGVLPNRMAPGKHLRRKQDLIAEMNP